MNTPPPEKTVSVWYVLRFVKSYAGLIGLAMLFLIAGRIAASLDPIWLKKIVDGVAGRSTWEQLGSVIGVYFLLKLASAAFDFLRDYAFAPAESGVARTLSEELFRHLLTLQIGYHTEQRIGGLSRQITRAGRSVSFLMDILGLQILPTIFELVFVTALLFKLYSPPYAIVTFLTVAAYAVFTVWATEKRQKYRLGANKADDEVSSLEVDGLSNIETVKYFNNEPELLRRYAPPVNKRFQLSVASNRLFALVASGQAFILLGGLGIVLVMAVKQTLAGILTVGDLVLLTTYIVRLSSPISVLGFVYRSMKDGVADLDGMAQILHEDISVKEPERPQAVEKPRGEVAFDHVSFRYAANRDILKDVDFQVKPGEKVAFVGPSGVGKSTIVKLLFRLFDPSEGRIVIDGVELDKLSKDDRRRFFAIVPQEPALFNTTIAENIRFGKPEATLEEVKEAAKTASIDRFIESLPEQYETLVGERGVKLSGGEKQRVAIARAVIRDPRILVFDEATSSLDSRSEKAIQKSLNEVAQGRTTIAVAHRLSTIVDSDQIYVMDKGTIAERGTHPELLAKNGLYAKLWHIQSSGKHEEPESDILDVSSK